MNKQELIEKIANLDRVYGEKYYVALEDVLDLVKQLDEPETGHADEAPRYVKNILARLRELPEHDREVWLKAIMGEFERDFSRAKWREGYEQGKFEGEWVGQQLKDADKIRQELNKPVIPQFVADWIEVCKEHLTHSLYTAMTPNFMKENGQSLDLILWIKKASNQDIFARAWLDGYEVEEEKRYVVSLKNGQPLTKTKSGKAIYFNQDIIIGNYKFTRKELEEANFGWVFDCEGIEIEEVEDE